MATRSFPVCFAAGAVALTLGCATAARDVGEEATEGALSTLAGEEPRGKQPGGAKAAGPGGVPAEAGAIAVPAAEIGAGVAAGIVDRLARPEELADVEAVAERAGAAFARGLSRELALQLGEGGQIEALGHASAMGALRAAGSWSYLLAAVGGAALALLAVAALGGAGARRAARRLEVRTATPAARRP